MTKSPVSERKSKMKSVSGRQNVQAGFLRMGKAKYALIFDFRTLENIEANKFPILDEIRAIETGGDIPAS